MRFALPMMVLGLSCVLVGCAEQRDPLADIDGVRAWANRASAVGLWARVHGFVAAGDGRSDYRDATCPTVTSAGNVTTLRGDCTDADGRVYRGTVTISNLPDGGEDLRIDAFGESSNPETIPSLSGEVALRALAPERHSFALRLESEAPSEGTLRVTYDGTVEGGYEGPTLWSGAGQLELNGQGVEAETTDQLVDDAACTGAPAAGSTTLRSMEHTVVVTYDGAEDCDDAKNARWELDGVDQGYVDGVTCSVGRGVASAPPVPLFTALGLVATRLRRKRGGTRRRSRSPKDGMGSRVVAAGEERTRRS